MRSAALLLVLLLTLLACTGESDQTPETASDTPAATTATPKPAEATEADPGTAAPTAAPTSTGTAATATPQAEGSSAPVQADSDAVRTEVCTAQLRVEVAITAMGRGDDTSLASILVDNADAAVSDLSAAIATSTEIQVRPDGPLETALGALEALDLPEGEPVGPTDASAYETVTTELRPLVDLLSESYCANRVGDEQSFCEVVERTALIADTQPTTPENFRLTFGQLLESSRAATAAAPDRRRALLMEWVTQGTQTLSALGEQTDYDFEAIESVAEEIGEVFPEFIRVSNDLPALCDG